MSKFFFKTKSINDEPGHIENQVASYIVYVHKEDINLIPTEKQQVCKKIFTTINLPIDKIFYTESAELVSSLLTNTPIMKIDSCYILSAVTETDTHEVKVNTEELEKIDASIIALIADDKKFPVDLFNKA